MYLQPSPMPLDSYFQFLTITDHAMLNALGLKFHVDFSFVINFVLFFHSHSVFVFQRCGKIK